MTPQDEIIEMAKQAGWHIECSEVESIYQILTDFGKLVAAKAAEEEHSRILKMIENLSKVYCFTDSASRGSATDVEVLFAEIKARKPTQGKE